MSRTPSGGSAGTQVATGSANNVYTLMLVIALLALVGSAFYLGANLKSEYGYVLPFEGTEAYDAAMGEAEQFRDQLDQGSAKVRQALSEKSLRAGLSTAAEPTE